MMVAGDRFRFLKEQPVFYQVKGGSGRDLQRGFCPKCGSPVTLQWPAVPRVKMIQVGSLDDPSVFAPQTEVWMGSAHQWHSQCPATLKFDGPPLSGVRDRLDSYFAGRSTE